MMINDSWNSARGENQSELNSNRLSKILKFYHTWKYHLDLLRLCNLQCSVNVKCLILQTALIYLWHSNIYILTYIFPIKLCEIQWMQICEKFLTFFSSKTMGTSRLLQWLLAAVVLSLSSCLIVSEVHQLASSDSSAINMQTNETNRVGMTAIRRRRYVRFPTGSAAYLFDSGPPLGRNLGARFASQTQFPGSWRQQKALWRSPVIADYNRPVMSHRSPRLIFRDNDFPPIGGGAASFFQHSNQLPEFEDDIRGEIRFFLRFFQYMIITF